jgi:hypothetical protein
MRVWLGWLGRCALAGREAEQAWATRPSPFPFSIDIFLSII